MWVVILVSQGLCSPILYMTLPLIFLRFCAFWIQLHVQKAHLIIHFLSLHQPPYLLQEKYWTISSLYKIWKYNFQLLQSLLQENLLPFNNQYGGGTLQPLAFLPKSHYYLGARDLWMLEVLSLSILIIYIPRMFHVLDSDYLS